MVICVTHILRLVTLQATANLDEIAYFEGLLVDIVPAASYPTPPSPRNNVTRYESSITLIRRVGEKG